MVADTQKSKAQSFLSLHSSGKLLIMPNIWNPIGARMLEAKGYPAIATASAAIAESLGYADGENIKLETMLDILSRIARSVNVPVTADIESGYADSLEALKETTKHVIDTGVVGINIEDSLEEGGALRPVSEQCERIAVVREMASAHGLHLVINARVDSFLSGSFQSDEAQIEDAVNRANAYKQAGADCIYPIGASDRPTIAILRERISSPLNVLATPNAPALPDLQNMGMNRVTLGPFVFRSCLATFNEIANELQRFGSYNCFADQSLSGSDVSSFLIHANE